MLIGLWAAFTFEYCVRRRLMEHVLLLNQNKKEELWELGPLAALVIALTVISLMFQLIVFWFTIVKPDWQPKPEWLPLINEDCGTFNPVPNPPGEGPYYRFSRFEVPQFGEVGLPLGSYLGLLIQTKFFNGRMHFTGPMHKKGLKLLGRAVFFVGLTILLRLSTEWIC